MIFPMKLVDLSNIKSVIKFESGILIVKSENGMPF
jgi:hypothetical protein